MTERVRAGDQIRQLATALSNAEEQERNRLAQLLHDDVQQMLLALQMQAQVGLMGDDLGKMRAALQQVVDYSAETITKTRHLSIEIFAYPIKKVQFRI